MYKLVFAMPGGCSICAGPFTRQNPQIVCDGPCKEGYHTACAGVSSEFANFSGKQGISWMCVRCRAGSFVSSAPSHSSTDLMEIKNELKLFRDEQREFGKSVDFISGQFDALNVSIKRFEAALSRISELENKVTMLQTENNTLRTELNSLQQHTRINNIEFTGIPEKKNENVQDLIIKLGDAAGFNIIADDIDACHRVAHVNRDNRYPRAIIAKFVNRQKKSNLLAAIKRRRDLTSADIGVDAPRSNVYASDHLTATNKQLFKKCRLFCKDNNYKFCWLKECKIFIKRSEDSKAILVHDESVLTRLLGDRQ